MNARICLVILSFCARSAFGSLASVNLGAADAFQLQFTGTQIALVPIMGKEFCGLLREYCVTLHGRDLCKEQFRATPEGIEPEQVRLRVESTQEHCSALRREIRRYLAINSLPRAGAPNNPQRRYQAQER